MFPSSVFEIGDMTIFFVIALSSSFVDSFVLILNVSFQVSICFFQINFFELFTLHNFFRDSISNISLRICVCVVGNISKK